MNIEPCLNNLHGHLTCPGDITTLKCAYCGKGMYKPPTEDQDDQDQKWDEIEKQEIDAGIREYESDVLDQHWER